MRHRRNFGWLVLMLAVLTAQCVAGRAAAVVMYVNNAATNPNASGLGSWGNAKKYLQDALAAARINQSITEIWVAKGTYRPAQSITNENGNSRSMSFVLVNGVSMYGGFQGWETSLSQRVLPAPTASPTTNESILSGDYFNNDVFSLNNIESELLPFYADNAYCVVRDALSGDIGPVVTASLDGFTFSGACSTGGVLISKPGSSITIENCYFFRNLGQSRGAGINLSGQDSIARISRCMFYRNIGASPDRNYTCGVDPTESYDHDESGSAGAISIVSHARAEITNCKFISNHNRTGQGWHGTAGGSGGIRIRNAQAGTKITNCVFAYNTTLGNGWAKGGAIGIFNSPGQAITNCTLYKNSASVSGGGIANQNCDPLPASYCVVRNCLIWGNLKFVNNCCWVLGEIDGDSLSVNNTCSTYTWAPLNSSNDLSSGVGNFGVALNQVELLGMNACPNGTYGCGPDGLTETPDDEFEILAGSVCSDAGDSTALPLDSADLDGDLVFNEQIPFDLADQRRITQDLAAQTHPYAVADPQTGFIVDIGAYEVQRLDGDRKWKLSASGMFHQAEFWNPSGPPGRGETGIFDRPVNPSNPPYAVTLGSNATFGRLLIDKGDVTFDLLGNNIQLNSTLNPYPPVLTVGRIAGPDAILNLTSSNTGTGAIISSYGAAMGVDTNSSGILNVRNGTRLQLSDSLVVGVNGHGAMTIADGSLVTSGYGFIAQSPGSSGEVLVTGASAQNVSSTWSVSLAILIGNLTNTPSSIASLIVGDNATVFAGVPGFFGGILINPNGVLGGTGTVNATVVNFGQIEPGVVSGAAIAGLQGVGSLRINGNYSQVPAIPNQGNRSGRLNIDIVQSGSAVENDLLDIVNGQAQLGGGLFVNLAPGTVLPSNGSPLEFLHATSIAMAHPSFDVAYLPAITGKIMRVVYPGSPFDSGGDGAGGGGGTDSGTISLVVQPLNGAIAVNPLNPQPLPGTPVAAAVGEFNGDGIDDLAIIITNGVGSPGEMHVFFGSANGNPQESVQQYPLPVQPVGIVAATLDGNGSTDLAVVSKLNGTVAGKVTIFHNNATPGTFTNAQTIDVGVNPSSIAAGNLLPDAGTELVVAIVGSNPNVDGSLMLLKSGGSGTFTVQPGIIPIGPHPVVVKPGTLDNPRDLLSDLVVAQTSSNGANANSVAVVMNNNNGTFAPAVFYPVGHDPADLAVQDLNGDGLDDAVTANASIGDADGTISVLVNAAGGNGVLAPAVNLPIAGSHPYSLTAANLDALADPQNPDGDWDLAVLVETGSGTQQRIRVLRNDTSSSNSTVALTLLPEDPGSSNADGAVAIVSGDFNGDASADLVTISEAGNGGPGSGGAPGSGSGGGGGGKSGGGTDGPPPPRQASLKLLRNDSKPVVLCAADIAPPGGNGTVNVSDLLAVINGWGACGMPCPPSCAADINHDCNVNVSDLLAVISAWGPCP